MNMRNAYILIYRRKLQDESQIVEEDDEAIMETTVNNGSESAQDVVKEKEAAYSLGKKELVLDSSNPLSRQV